MRVVLARRRGAERGGPPEVHAYWRPDDDTSTAAWWAPCGAKITPENAELVPRFAGAPCDRCWLLVALGSDAAPVGRDEFARAVPEPAAAPEPVAAPDPALGAEWAASWSIRATHAVEPGAPRSTLYGRPVVLARCGELGWGPMAPPPGWPLCDGCATITGART
ncbi:hypothetical protein [Saccharopolyspora cebuensis]|uniref:Uncharacterized protein n=1 Tax=Saccharopolyspora cebuensis TaxID=418759 RepID=A0ABV4CGP2_9PSEU